MMAGIKLAANIKPYMMQTHPHYPGWLKHMGGFVKEAESDAFRHLIMPGATISIITKRAVTSISPIPDTYDWWQKMAKDFLLDKGIDSLWNDNNEFALWDDDARCDGFGEEIRLGMARPLLTLLMTRASYEAQRENRWQERPFVLTRAATPGSQRYAQTWSGDNVTSWETLAI